MGPRLYITFLSGSAKGLCLIDERQDNDRQTNPGEVTEDGINFLQTNGWKTKRARELKQGSAASASIPAENMPLGMIFLPPFPYGLQYSL